MHMARDPTRLEGMSTPPLGRCRCEKEHVPRQMNMRPTRNAFKHLDLCMCKVPGCMFVFVCTPKYFCRKCPGIPALSQKARKARTETLFRSCVPCCLVLCCLVSVLCPDGTRSCWTPAIGWAPGSCPATPTPHRNAAIDWVRAAKDGPYRRFGFLEVRCDSSPTAPHQGRDCKSRRSFGRSALDSKSY
jgi:hypothetical protein